MRMGDRDGQCVRGVRSGDGNAGQQPLDHCVYLFLAGVADADDRFLDQPRRIFTDRDARACRVQQDDAARLPQLQCRLRVAVDEYLLDPRAIGPVGEDQVGERGVERQQPRGERRLRIGPDLSVGNVGEAVAVGQDDAPAGGGQPGIEAEDDARRWTGQGQPSFSITASDTS